MIFTKILSQYIIYFENGPFQMIRSSMLTRQMKNCDENCLQIYWWLGGKNVNLISIIEVYMVHDLLPILFISTILLTTIEGSSGLLAMRLYHTWLIVTNASFKCTANIQLQSTSRSYNLITHEKWLFLTKVLF
jgi:hypothetical protein